MASLIVLKKRGMSDSRTHGKSLHKLPKPKRESKYKHKNWSKISLKFINKYKVIFVNRRVVVFAHSLQDAKQLACDITGKELCQLKEITKL